MIWTGKGSNHLTSWAEMESGDSYCRTSSLLMSGGDRHGDNSATVNAGTRLSPISNKTQSPANRYLEHGNLQKLSGFTHLLSPQHYHLNTVINKTSQYRLRLNQGLPEVTFLGDESPAETHLLWRGHSYKVAMLSQNERWQPDQKMAREPDSAAEDLLNRHLAFGDPALLLPATTGLKQAGDSNTQTTDWLVIRHNPQQSISVEVEPTNSGRAL